MKIENTEIAALKQKAEQGDAEAQCELGRRFAEGEGVPPDYSEMVKWYRLAAEQGNANAQFALGVIYDEVDYDKPKAFGYFIKAGNQYHAEANYRLGVIEGARANIEQATLRYEGAADKGHAGALYKLGEMFKNRELKRTEEKSTDAWAYIRYSMAALLGHGKLAALAVENRDIMRKKLTNDNIKKADGIISREIEKIKQGQADEAQ